MSAPPAISRVLVASKNPVKIHAVRDAFSRALPHLKLEFAGDTILRTSLLSCWAGRAAAENAFKWLGCQ